ncbi:hypothetical protein OAA91_02070 [Fibrobacterales bacterium]|nr:hypothetical protein [Fibrobacterales bacterium]
MNFLFPIETTARELDHKLLMAVKAIKPGVKVYVGEQQMVRNLSYIVKGGVFYGKHLFGKPKFSDQDYYKRLKKNNFNLVHLNEEGAVWPGGDEEWNYLLAQAERPSVLDSNDYMVVWGDWQKKFNDNIEKHNTNVVVTGHPRFDLCRKKYTELFSSEVESLKETYGDFILVNTAFSYANNGQGGVGFIFKPTISYDINDEKHRKYRFVRWKTQMFSLADIVNLVNDLSIKYPNKNIILRPHPSEDTAMYKDIFQGISNVKVVYEGTVTPWLLACKLLIHNGCTTAIEASLAGKPVINFRTNYNPKFDIYLANICGKTIDNTPEIIENVEEIFKGDFKVNLPIEKLANDLFNNFKEENTADSVVEYIEKASHSIDSSEIKHLTVFKRLLLNQAHRLYLFAKYSTLFFQGRFKEYIDFKKRFIKYNTIDVDLKILNLSKIVGKEVRIKRVNNYLLELEEVLPK